MQLNAQLVDVSRNLGPLRVVLFQLSPQFSDARFRFGDLFRADRGNIGNYSGFAALLTGQAHSSGGDVYHQRGGAMDASECDVAYYCGHAGWSLDFHKVREKQVTYPLVERDCRASALSTVTLCRLR
ncbi:MAG: hypothetical protein QOG67_3683 [Verrucomicrobiota bacterium]